MVGAGLKRRSVGGHVVQEWTRVTSTLIRAVRSRVTAEINTVCDKVNTTLYRSFFVDFPTHALGSWLS